MKTVKHYMTFFALWGAVALLLYLLSSTGIVTLQIKNAQPMLLLPLIVSVAMAAREWPGLVFGALCGIMLDITAADSYFFNFLTLAVLGCACGLCCSYLLNDNFYAALVLSLGCAVCYFAAHWIVFYLAVGSPDSLKYLIRYSLPSAIYTTVFIIPFYFPVRFLSKKMSYVE